MGKKKKKDAPRGTREMPESRTGTGGKSAGREGGSEEERGERRERGRGEVSEKRVRGRGESGSCIVGGRHRAGIPPLVWFRFGFGSFVCLLLEHGQHLLSDNESSKDVH